MEKRVNKEKYYYGHVKRSEKDTFMCMNRISYVYVYEKNLFLS